MNAEAILALVAQGLALLPTLIQTGVDVMARIEQMRALANAGATGSVTDAQIAEYRAQLDSDLADFNTPIPDDSAKP
jgi:NAD(P)H-dependent flavin oxidoreductase YrpB (nitropropane dioxygenase family)